MRRILLTLWLAALPAQASDWLDIGARGPDRMYYDLAKLHIAGQVVTYWRRVDYRMPMPTADGLAYSGLYRERIDCAQRTLASLGYLLYGDDRKVIANVYLPNAPGVTIVPESIAEQFARSLCPIVQAHEELAKQERDPKAAELKRLEEELKALEESIRSLRTPGAAEPSGAPGDTQ
jgi:hypothetical protein